MLVVWVSIKYSSVDFFGQEGNMNAGLVAHWPDIYADVEEEGVERSDA